MFFIVTRVLICCSGIYNY